MTRSQFQAGLIDNLAEFQVDPERGFLPSADPLDRLPGRFDPWEHVARELPKLLVAGKIRPVLKRLPVLDASGLRDERENHRAMLLLSFLGHAYVWGQAEAGDRIPAGVAIPWYEVSRRLGRPPVLSYASYALDNWRRLDREAPVALGNIVLLQNFLGGLDEEWFVLVHVEIEAKAASALAAIPQAQKAVTDGQPGELADNLAAIASSLESICQTLLRMPEHCDPHIYYNRVRPYIYGWKNHPALPEGVIYEGVEAYAGEPQMFRGETGAQSSIVPSLDAALGIMHKDDPLRTYLVEMRDYMPPEHRAFVEAVEQGPSIRQYVLEHRQSSTSLTRAYNDCVDWLELFRSQHLEYAESYIQKQSQHGRNNPVDVGTGGTPFILYLKKHRNETSEHRIA